MRNDSVTLGLIVGNRGFFPDHLAQSGREEMIGRPREGRREGGRRSAPDDTKHGAVETREESRKCADLFRRHRDEIDGVIVTLPNFGEERGDRGRPAAGGPRRPGADPGDAGRRRRR